MHFVVLRMQLLGMKRRMKLILSEEIGLGGGFTLNGLGEFLEQLIEGRGRRELEHDRLVDQLPQRFPPGDAAGAVILLRSIQGV